MKKGKGFTTRIRDSHITTIINIKAGII